ncbi:MAG: DUF1801 domain-containing protein [Acidiferrobacterales bacterium]|nr:DUF1801 domain-containing protein [Acidiferrobacterales bacterium]
MAELKTQPSRKSVSKFLGKIENAERKQDCDTLVSLMRAATGEKPVLWGENIVGFGKYHYQQRSGQAGSWPLIGFSPRKQNISIYIMPGFSNYQPLLKKLGKHKHSVSCLYISKLSVVELDILKEIMVDSVRVMREKYS